MCSQRKYSYKNLDRNQSLPASVSFGLWSLSGGWEKDFLLRKLYCFCLLFTLPIPVNVGSSYPLFPHWYLYKNHSPTCQIKYRMSSETWTSNKEWIIFSVPQILHETCLLKWTEYPVFLFPKCGTLFNHLTIISFSILKLGPCFPGFLATYR